jgi:hypothetical protein
VTAVEVVDWLVTLKVAFWVEEDAGAVNAARRRSPRWSRGAHAAPHSVLV